MKNKFLIVIGLLVFTGYSCSNDEGTPKDEVRFYWNQTGCADPWNTGQNNTNEETEIAVWEFLEEKNVTVQNVEFDTNSPLATDCEACDCGTGQRIIVDVIGSDILKMEELGFYK